MPKKPMDPVRALEQKIRSVVTANDVVGLRAVSSEAGTMINRAIVAGQYPVVLELIQEWELNIQNWKSWIEGEVKAEAKAKRKAKAK